jgi:hypothetical protein
MIRNATHSFWQQLRQFWLAGAPIADPRLAADAGRMPLVARRYLWPLVGAWLH